MLSIEHDASGWSLSSLMPVIRGKPPKAMIFFTFSQPAAKTTFMSCSICLMSYLKSSFPSCSLVARSNRSRRVFNAAWYSCMHSSLENNLPCLPRFATINLPSIATIKVLDILSSLLQLVIYLAFACLTLLIEYVLDTVAYVVLGIIIRGIHTVMTGFCWCLGRGVRALWLAARIRTCRVRIRRAGGLYTLLRRMCRVPRSSYK